MESAGVVAVLALVAASCSKPKDNSVKAQKTTDTTLALNDTTSVPALTGTTVAAAGGKTTPNVNKSGLSGGDDAQAQRDQGEEHQRNQRGRLGMDRGRVIHSCRLPMRISSSRSGVWSLPRSS